MNDVAPGLRPSRSGPHSVPVRVPDISDIKKRLARVTRRDWSDAHMQDFDDHARNDMARLIAIIEADRRNEDRSESDAGAEPPQTPLMESE